jgi:RNA polymerase sigma factor (sigma-70 family)
MLQKAKEGDANALMEVMLEFEGMNKKLANRYRVPEHIFEELVQEGNIGLMKAVQVYDETKGAFSTIAYRCIQSAQSNYMKKYVDREKSKQVIKYQRQYADNDSDMQLLLKGIKCLDPVEQELITSLFGIGKDPVLGKDIAEKWNTHPNMISRTKKRIIQKLQSIVEVLDDEQ